MNTRQIEVKRAELLKWITVLGNSQGRATPKAEQALANSETAFLRLGRQLQEQKATRARTRMPLATTT